MQYTISLKRKADADLIARIEAEREKGKSAAEAIKSLIRADIENGGNKMDYKQALIDLIAYCEREGTLPSDSTIIGKLAEILNMHCYEVAELLE